MTSAIATAYLEAEQRAAEFEARRLELERKLRARNLERPSVLRDRQLRALYQKGIAPGDMWKQMTPRLSKRRVMKHLTAALAS